MDEKPNAADRTDNTDDDEDDADSRQREVRAGAALIGQWVRAVEEGRSAVHEPPARLDGCQCSGSEEPAKQRGEEEEERPRNQGSSGRQPAARCSSWGRSGRRLHVR